MKNTNSLARFLYGAAVLLGMATTCLPAADAKPPTLDDLLRQIAAYDYDQSRAPLRAFELAVVRAAKDDKARKAAADNLAKLLTAKDVKPAAKHFVCKQLAIIGDASHLPVLVGLLADKELAESARIAIASIPGAEATAALRTALPTTTGRLREGVILSLGRRRDAASAEAIAGLLDKGDPATAQAAARALGYIGSLQAADVLAAAKVPESVHRYLVNARLLCAEQLLADGQAQPAAKTYAELLSSSADVRVRVAALVGLGKAGGEHALPAVLKAMDDAQPIVRATAVRVARGLKGSAVTKALCDRLPKLTPDAKVVLLDVLAARGDQSAASAAASQLAAKELPVRTAAATALGVIGTAESVDVLAAAAAKDDGPVRTAARGSLGRLAGEGVDQRVLALAAEAKPAVRVEALAAVAARRLTTGESVLLAAAESKDEAIAAAGLRAIGQIGSAKAYPRVVALVAGADEATGQAARKAAVSLAARVEPASARVTPVRTALAKAAPAGKARLLALLGSLGGSEALAAVQKHLGSADTSVQDAAVRALASWPDASAAPDLLRIAKQSESVVHRTLALRGYMRLVQAPTVVPADRVKMLQAARAMATDTAAKRMFLGALGQVADAGALDVAMSFQADKEVQAEAELAVLTVADKLLATDRAAARAGLGKLLKATKNPQTTKRAQALLARKPRRRGRPAAANPALLRPNPKRTADLKAALAKKAPKGYRLACYVDCGPDKADGPKGKPSLRVVSGGSYVWPAVEAAGPVQHGTICFDARRVAVQVAGLDPKKTYQVGFTWWDFDHNDRVQSVSILAGKPPRTAQLLKPTKLPSYLAGRNAAATITVPIPRGLSVFGSATIEFRLAGGTNVVLSEVWLWESEAASAAAEPAPVPSKSPEPARVMTPKPVTPGKKAAKRILFLTGDDYPGHKWKLTTPVLAPAIDKDPRLAVEVVEDPNFLASGKLGDYDAIVLHWMNWRKPDPGAKARKDLDAYVRGGGGLVMVHFACGAFQAWPDFVKIAGRVWNPKLRGHDPRGPFEVNIVKPDHPIMKGLKPFRTTDELYTCLDGKTPIEILATATSKVDKKVYPMAFVLNPGKGRVFQSPLGHDVKAFEAPEVKELFRRATAWAAGLPPVADK